MFAKSLILAAAFLACSTSAQAMCGSKPAGAATMQSKPASQCMGSMQGGSMQGMDMPANKDAGAAPADPHAGMDMGDKSKGGMGCCSCCGDGASGKSGGMCGKQAALATEDGKNDPLLSDPMWERKPGTQTSR